MLGAHVGGGDARADAGERRPGDRREILEPCASLGARTGHTHRESGRGAAETIHDQHRERLGREVLAHHEQWSALSRRRLQRGNHLGGTREHAVAQEHERLIE